MKINKKLLSVLLFIGVGIGLASNVVAMMNNSQNDRLTNSNREFVLSQDIVVNVPINIIFNDDWVDAEAVAESDLAKEVEAELAVEPEPEATVQSEMSFATKVNNEPEPAVLVAPNSIQITGRTLTITDVDDTLMDAGNQVNRFGEKFLYGHNSWSVFGELWTVGVGETFSVTLNGVEQNYRVKKTIVFAKNTKTERIEIGGTNLDKNGNDYMDELAYGRFMGVQYGLSIMTCSGESYGNGDASHRLVIFADAV